MFPNKNAFEVTIWAFVAFIQSPNRDEKKGGWVFTRLGAGDEPPLRNTVDDINPGLP